MKSGVKEKFRRVVINEKGFTTLELIFVIVIAGIMAAIAIPRMGNVSNVDAYTTARQVKSDIRYTQQRAMSKFKKTRIEFVGGADTYSIYTETGGVRTIIANKSLPSSSKATFDATYEYEFGSDGSPAAIVGGWIVGITSGVQSRTIEVSSDTGRVTIP